MKKNRHQNKPKKLTEHRRMKLQKHIDWLMKNGVKDKGRAKRPSMTKNCGRVIR
jgi:hypothetical protein